MRYRPVPSDLANLITCNPSALERLHLARVYSAQAMAWRAQSHTTRDSVYRQGLRAKARQYMGAARAFLWAALERMAEAERVAAPMFYRLPMHWTWWDVVRNRAKWGVPAGLYPLASARGVTGWGTPMRPAGRRLSRPRLPATLRGDVAAALDRMADARRMLTAYPRHMRDLRDSYRSVFMHACDMARFVRPCADPLP